MLDGHFVADEWAGIVPTFSPPQPATPFYGLRFPFLKVGVAAGIARATIDEFVSLASGKRPLFASGNPAEWPGSQAAIARAEAGVSSGLAWVHEMLDELWMVAKAGSPVPMELHARCWLACSHAVDASITTIDQLCREAGTTANRPDAPLQQLLLDARAVAGHFMVAPYQMNTAGRILLGLDPADRHF